MNIVVVVLGVFLALAALICGIVAVVQLLGGKRRVLAGSLVLSVIAVVLAVVSVVCLLFLSGYKAGAGGSDESNGEGTADPTGQSTSSTTVSTGTTTRMPTQTSSAANAGQILVNIPATDKMAQDSLTQLVELCQKYNGKVSFYYIDLESGYEIEYRADRAYQAASVIKAPYVKYLLATGVDGSKKLTMTAKQGGSGIIDKQPVGTTFTVDQLMEYAIRYSDNTAYYMLNKEFGFAGFNKYAQELGITANANSNCVLGFPRPRFGYLSARDIGLYMEDIAKFIATDSEDAKRLKSWMTSSSEESQLVNAFSDKNVLYGKNGTEQVVDGDGADAVNFHYTVAHKYGDTKNIEYAFHDGAIVYAEKPFVLAVATSLEPFSEESIEVFHEIAFQINKIHYAYHAK